jgi:hypothetical protein
MKALEPAAGNHGFSISRFTPSGKYRRFAAKAIEHRAVNIQRRTSKEGFLIPVQSRLFEVRFCSLYPPLKKGIFNPAEFDIILLRKGNGP